MDTIPNPQLPAADDAPVEIIGEVLAGMDGNHAWLTPVYDPTGELLDFQIAAASGAARDIPGRRGAKLLGVHVRQAYPHTVHGATWQAYLEAFRDGEPRTVGPMPYTGPITSVPETLEITMLLRRAGPGLLVSWTLYTGKDRLAERIAQTERLGNLGWSEQDLVTGETVWSEQLYRIYDRDPAHGPPSAAESDTLTVPEDRPIRRRVAERLARGRSADATYRIRTSRGIQHIRVVADTVRDVNGRPLRAYGIVQDVTYREQSRHKIEEVEQELVARQQDLAAEHRLATELREIILPTPPSPVDLPGLRVAVRYLPAEQAHRIGGDWYHAATGYDGSAILAIGDVAGHGLPAAAAMAQLRNAFTALSSTATTDPAALLSHLNRLLFTSGEPQTVASAVAARYDPVDRTLCWAQAGHPAPLRSCAGATAPLARPAGPLLGAMPDAEYGTAQLTVDDGDLLVFYTDGLVERRGRTIEDGLEPIVATLNQLSARRRAQPLADLLTRLDRANPDDDTCVVAVRAIPYPPADSHASPATVAGAVRASPAPRRAGDYTG